MIQTVTKLRERKSQTILRPPSNNSSFVDNSPSSSGFHDLASSPGLEMKIPHFVDHTGDHAGDHAMPHTDLFDRNVLRLNGANSPLPEIHSAKWAATTQSPSESSIGGKRKASHVLQQINACLKQQIEECAFKDCTIESLTDDLDRIRKQVENANQEHADEVRNLKEEIRALRYENAQLKAFNEEVAGYHASGTGEERVRKLEAMLANVRRELSDKEQDNMRLRAKVDKLNDDYVRLSEDFLIDPADSFAPRNIECTFRPITPPIDDHQCFNPSYSENCAVSNKDISTTAKMFSKFVHLSQRPATNLENLLQAASSDELRKKKEVDSTPSTPWWSKARSKKSSKWIEHPCLPGTSMNQCAATEHLGRLFVAGTVVGTQVRPHSPTPLPSIVLYVMNEKEKKFVNFNVPSPPDAVHPTGLFSDQDRLYLVTAQEGGDSIWRLDASTKQWIFLSATICGETACAVCMVGDHIILAGGDMKDETGSCSTVKSFSVESMTWNLGWPAMRNRRHAARLIHANNSLFIVGGGTGSKLMGFDTMQTVECLSLNNLIGGWVNIMNVKELAPAAMSTGSNILLVGGLYRKPMMKRTGYSATVRFTTVGVEADELPMLNVERSAACLVSFGSRVFCIGGCAQKGFCSAVEELVVE